MGLYSTVTEAIGQYTGLSPAAIFTILAFMVVIYKVVCGMFVAADDYMAMKRENSFALREPVQLGDVTEDELRGYDGSDPNKPLLMAITGNIYDVSRSRRLVLHYPVSAFHSEQGVAICPGQLLSSDQESAGLVVLTRTRGDHQVASSLPAYPEDVYDPGGPYALFAGRDASRALALMSFEPNDLTGKIDGLCGSELEVLQDWEYKFMEKYVKVGQLVSERARAEQNMGGGNELDDQIVESNKTD